MKKHFQSGLKAWRPEEREKEGKRGGFIVRFAARSN